MILKINDVRLSKILGIDPAGIVEFEYDIIKNADSFVPWNKGKKGLQIPWNKGTKGLYSLTQETREKLRKVNLGKKLSAEHKRKIGLANSISKKGCVTWNKDVKYSRDKLVNCKKAKKYEIVYPCGKIIIIKNLALWCRENNISNSNMCAVAKNKKESFKGFKCKYV